MSTELTLAQNNPTAINKVFGFTGRPAPAIPYLRVNGADDEDGTKAPKGTFVYEDGERILYSITVVSIRSFLKAYQYRLFDGKDQSKNDTSVIGADFKTEFRSTSGRIACGKINKRAAFELGDNISTSQKYFQDNVKCKLLVFGLVSGTFIDLDTKKSVELKDELFTWAVSQSGFMAIDQAITGIAKERRAVPCTPIRLSLKKDKMGAVTYYIPVPEVLNETVAINVEKDEASLNKIKEFVKDTNDYVNSKYNEALGKSNEGKSFAKASDIIEGRAKEDFTDDTLDL